MNLVLRKKEIEDRLNEGNGKGNRQASRGKNDD